MNKFLIRHLVSTASVVSTENIYVHWTRKKINLIINESPVLNIEAIKSKFEEEFGTTVKKKLEQC